MDTRLEEERRRVEEERKRLGREEEEKNAPPQFMSTHPSNHNRLEQIRQWLPEAEAKRDSSECSTMMGYGMSTELAKGTLRLVANHFRSG